MHRETKRALPNSCGLPSIGAMKDEMILVVRRALFDELGAFQGLNFEIDRYLPALLARENNFFTPRPPAETDPSLKQIIPYVLLVHEGRVLHYVRGKKAGEQRLVAKGSVGIGGHMNDHDEGLFALDRAAYDAAVQREVGEELKIGTRYTNHAVALLNDDSNEVGKVHLGVVHIFQLETAEVQKGEAMITELQFLDRPALAAKRDALESWSQICFDNLDALLAAAR
jgi:predicted NUDIX family phosphoesterase